MTKEEIAATLRSISESVAELAKHWEEEQTTAPVKEDTAAEEKKPIRLEDVRAVLSEISRSGHTAEMKALLAKHGAKKLSDIKPEDYEELLTEAREVKDA